MQRKNLGTMECPIARSLERVGEWWSILILRDAIYGITRFDAFQKNLRIAPNILTRRLQALVDAGMLEKRLYCERPKRYEYVITPRGRDFRPVLLSLQAWGSRHYSPEGVRVMLVDAETGEPADPVLIDRNTGKLITDATHRNVPGPAAGAGVKARLGKPRLARSTSQPEPHTVTSKPVPTKKSATKRRPRSNAADKPSQDMPQ